MSPNMAPLNIQPFTKVLFLLVLFALLLVPSSSVKATIQLVGRRNLLEKNHVQEYSDGVQQSAKKKQGTTTIALGTTTQSKNKTKLIKPTTSNSTKTLEKTNLKKLNSTSKHTSKTSTLSSKSTNSTKPTSKSTNSTKPTSKTPTLSSKSTNSTKPTSKSSNNTKPTSKTSNPTKPTSTLTQKSKDPTKKNKPTIEKKSTKTLTFAQKEEQEEEDDDLISEFKDLPTRFQETLIPDLEVISTTSKSYLNNANKQISKQFKPLVGKKYAPIVASIISFAFIIIPFLLVTLIFNQIKAYFSLQKIIIFIQIYLSIYFSILALSSLVTGLEPLKFFYNISESTYVCIQLLQTLCYVLYLLLVLMYFVLVFSTESGVGSRVLGLGQVFVGFAVGLHCYMTVFHRAVLRQPPKTSWKVHSVYATCFLLICLLATAERRKKAYVVDGCEEEKKN